MCKIANFMKKECIACRMELKTKEELFKYIAENAEANAGIPEDSSAVHTHHKRLD